jgi:hypothetical protein
MGKGDIRMNPQTLTENEERVKILRMIEDGRISASEGASLLDALSADRENRSREPYKKQNISSDRWFRVRVTNMYTGKAKATVNIPMRLMDLGLKIGAQFAPEVADVNLDEIGEMIRSGVEGKIVEVIDEEDGEHVEIFVD